MRSSSCFSKTWLSLFTFLALTGYGAVRVCFQNLPDINHFPIGEQTGVEVPDKQEGDLIDPHRPVAKKLDFLFWTDFSVEDDARFIMDLGAELCGWGHQVLIESPVDGVTLWQLDLKYDFGVRVNPILQKVISGKTSIWSAWSEKDELPDMIILFSSVWSRSLLQLPSERPDVRLIWYFYRPLRWERKDQDVKKAFQSMSPVSSTLESDSHGNDMKRSCHSMPVV